jgi:hypothetical protein
MTTRNVQKKLKQLSTKKGNGKIRPLAPLISFSPNASHQTEQDHLPQTITLRITDLLSPTSDEIFDPMRHDPLKPKRPKKDYHKALAILQWSKRWLIIFGYQMHHFSLFD